MRHARVALVTLFRSIAAFAQTPGLGETRPVDPAAREPAGADLKRPPVAPPAPERSQNDNERAPSRCAELAGTARDDCVREERAGAGATRRAEPPSAPPPQNPR
jgi:hypothetical protein